MWCVVDLDLVVLVGWNFYIVDYDVFDVCFVVFDCECVLVCFDV